MTRDEQWLLEEKYNGITTEEFEADRNRLAKGEPVGYVIGYQPFLGLKIYLDSNPLIPRPETEWWTEQMLKKIIGRDSTELFSVVRLGLAARSATENDSGDKHLYTTKFLDLCAGSGAIGCAALAKLPNAQVYFGEIDTTHKDTILKNIRENNLDISRTEISIGDLFEPFADMTFDVIAINPPYIPTGRELEESVTAHEPPTALYAGEDGLYFIRRIAKELYKHLKKNGEAWVECDSAHAAAACALFVEQGISASIRTDQYGVPRIIICSHNSTKTGNTDV